MIKANKLTECKTKANAMKVDLSDVPNYDILNAIAQDIKKKAFALMDMDVKYKRYLMKESMILDVEDTLL